MSVQAVDAGANCHNPSSATGRVFMMNNTRVSSFDTRSVHQEMGEKGGRDRITMHVIVVGVENQPKH